MKKAQTNRRVLWRSLVIFFWIAVAASLGLVFLSSIVGLLGIVVLGAVCYIYRLQLRIGNIRKEPPWFVALDGVTIGPYRRQELRTLAGRRLVTPQALACQEGQEDWQPVGLRFPDLKFQTGEEATAVQTAPPIRDGFMHTVGSGILIFGFMFCFTVGIPVGLAMVLVGGIMRIPAH